ncbi:MAG: von Willebrand factor type A domain-containing protein [Defluviitaleaceae bacterium]|nr:von Willebrand factor type A domain-containing protein [Defluviitaleaceae bacterium]
MKATRMYFVMLLFVLLVPFGACSSQNETTQEPQGAVGQSSMQTESSGEAVAPSGDLSGGQGQASTSEPSLAVGEVELNEMPLALAIEDGNETAYNEISNIIPMDSETDNNILDNDDLEICIRPLPEDETEPKTTTTTTTDTTTTTETVTETGIESAGIVTRAETNGTMTSSSREPSLSPNTATTPSYTTATPSPMPTPAPTSYPSSASDVVPMEAPPQGDSYIPMSPPPDQADGESPILMAPPAPAAPSAPSIELEFSYDYASRADFGIMEAPPYHNREQEQFFHNTERYIPIVENAVVSTAEETAVSFTLQIDTASYGTISRYISSGSRPPSDAVRVAEMLNYFTYDTPLQATGSPFAVYTEVGRSPFNADRHLAFVRVKAQDISRDELPGNNLTFLIDTSGSMSPANRLPLLKEAFGVLVETLNARDIVSVVTYAGSAEVLLDSVRGNEYEKIMNAINSLEANGSTAGGPGITKAYELANKNFNSEMNNRIILATDGDFNVGVSSVEQLERMMNEQRGKGIHMTILGVGVGNYTSSTMETVARNGNGAYHYIDNLRAARKIFVEELTSNLFVIAEEVRSQIVFNADRVESYRLIGYENRTMDNRHFDDDSRDAGEVGVGSDLVIMFELKLRERAVGDLFNVRIRYHNPGEATSRLVEVPAGTERILTSNTSEFTFAAAVAAFGHILRSSEHNRTATIPLVISMANDSIGSDEHGHRRGFLEMVEGYDRGR